MSAAATMLRSVRRDASDLVPAGLRVGIHVSRGVPGQSTDADVAHCRHIRDVAPVGQVLLAEAAVHAIPAVPDGYRLVDLGDHRLSDLAGAVRLHALAATDDPGPAALPRSLDRVPNNLPGQLTRFLGRDGELATVRALMVEHRLLTLTGIGGAGKTRLGLHAVAGIVGSWPDGVWWADLGAVTDPGRVAG